MVIETSGNPTFKLIGINTLSFCLSPANIVISCVGATDKLAILGTMQEGSVPLTGVLIKNLDTDQIIDISNPAGESIALDEDLVVTVDSTSIPGKLGYSIQLIEPSVRKWALQYIPTDQDSLIDLESFGNPTVFLDTDGWWKGCMEVLPPPNEDGKWTLVSRDNMSSDVPYTYDGIAHTNDRYFLIGGDIGMSADSESWTCVAFNTNSLHSLAGNNSGIVIAGGKDNTSSHYQIYRSVDDGVTFNKVTLTNIDVGNITKLVYGNGIFVGMITHQFGSELPSSYSNILTSSDLGQTWTAELNYPSTSSNPIGMCSLIFANGAFYASATVNGNITVWKSLNGINWTLVMEGGPIVYLNYREVQNGLQYCNGMLLVGGTRNIYSSDDGGNTWNMFTMETTAERLCTSFAYGNGIYVASVTEFQNGMGVYVSDDGTNWEYIPTSDVVSANNYKVIYGENEFVMIGYGFIESRISMSYNGRDWFKVHPQPVDEFTNPPQQYGEFSDIIYHSGQYLAVGSEGYNSFFNPTFLARGRWYNSK